MASKCTQLLLCAGVFVLMYLAVEVRGDGYCYACVWTSGVDTTDNNKCENPSPNTDERGDTDITVSCSGSCFIASGKSGDNEVVTRGCASLTNVFGLSSTCSGESSVEVGSESIKTACCTNESDKNNCNGAMAGINITYIMMLLSAAAPLILKSLF